MLRLTAEQLRPAPPHRHSGVLQRRNVIDQQLYERVKEMAGLTSAYALDVRVEFGSVLRPALAKLLFMELGSKGQQTVAVTAPVGHRSMMFCESNRAEQDFWYLELLIDDELEFWLDRRRALRILRTEYDSMLPQPPPMAFDDYARHEIAIRLAWLLRRVQRCLARLKANKKWSFAFE